MRNEIKEESSLGKKENKENEKIRAQPWQITRIRAQPWHIMKMYKIRKYENKPIRKIREIYKTENMNICIEGK